jgi:hypothetical protein
MPENVVPTIEGKILGLLSSVMDEFNPDNIKEHESQWTEGMSEDTSRTHTINMLHA